MMREIKVKEWIIEKAQEESRRYNIYMDYSRRNENGQPVRDEGFVYIKVDEILEETEKAIKARIVSGEIIGSNKGWMLWIPKSQIATI